MPLEAPWGDIFTLEQIAAALDQHPRAKLLGIVHAETSTGAHQPLAGLADIVHAHGALLMVDTVTSLGGHDLRVDEWGIDACYSCTQKCLSCPPGLAPVTFGERALARMDARKTKPQSWYLDVSMLRKYYLGDNGVAFLPPHRAQQHDLRAARGAAHRRRGRPRGPHRPPRSKCICGCARAWRRWA